MENNSYIYPYQYPNAYEDTNQHTVFSRTLLDSAKKAVRESTNDFDDEILSYIEGCAQDLIDAGILPSFFEVTDKDVWQCDPRILQAVRWYCQGHYGLYNADMEKYLNAYASLKATLCTQRRYTKKEF